MSNIRVAILDTGISNELVEDNRIKLNNQIYYDYYEEKVVISNDSVAFNGHGSLCVRTIWEMNPNVEIYSINMLGISGVTNSIVLLEALKYVEKLDVDIVAICASCIVKSKQVEIRDVCKRLHDSGKVIVASVENGKEVSSIADYETVIGVIGSEFEKNEYSFSENQAIQMCCDSREYVINGLRGIRHPFSGNSRATAIAVGIVSKLMLHNENAKEDIIKLLIDNRTSNRENEKKIMVSENEFFDYEHENQLIETDEGYIKFLFVLCEALLLNNPDAMRTVHLLDFQEGKLVRKIHDLVGFIENRFNVEIHDFYLDDFKWAYLFYEKHIVRRG